MGNNIFVRRVSALALLWLWKRQGGLPPEGGTNRSYSFCDSRKKHSAGYCPPSRLTTGAKSDPRPGTNAWKTWALSCAGLTQAAAAAGAWKIAARALPGFSVDLSCAGRLRAKRAWCLKAVDGCFRTFSNNGGHALQVVCRTTQKRTRTSTADWSQSNIGGVRPEMWYSATSWKKTMLWCQYTAENERQKTMLQCPASLLQSAAALWNLGDVAVRWTILDLGYCSMERVVEFEYKYLLSAIARCRAF